MVFLNCVQFAMKVPVVEEIPTSPSCFSALWKVLRSSFTKRQVGLTALFQTMSC